MKRAILSAVVILATAGPAVPQETLECPPETTPAGAASVAGRQQWCERSTRAGPIRHGPTVGWHQNGQKSLEIQFVEGTPRGPITAWYESGRQSASGHTEPDNGTLILWDEAGRKRAEIEVRARRLAAKAWDENGREEPYEEARLKQALSANRDLGFIMTLFAVGIGIQ